MLVLSRKLGEKVRIGDQIVVTVLKTQGRTVRLGIEAPAEVRVLRAELPIRETETAHEPATPLIRESRRTTIALASGAGRTDHRQQRRDMDASTSPRRAQPHHPARWSVASMRDRVQSSLAGADPLTVSQVK
jgi:carbon storage regulator